MRRARGVGSRAMGGPQEQEEGRGDASVRASCPHRLHRHRHPPQSRAAGLRAVHAVRVSTITTSEVFFPALSAYFHFFFVA